MSTVPNPYAPPTARVEDATVGSSEDEAIRQEHIKHETSVRSVGLLYYMGGVMTALIAVSLLTTGFAGAVAGAGPVLGAVYLVLSVLSFVVGYGVRGLQPWARITSIVLSCIGLLGFPLGTLLNAYILYLMLSKKGKRVFESDYAAIVAATPYIKYTTSLVVWILLALLLIGVAAAILIPMLNR